MPARTRRLAFLEGVTAGVLFGTSAIFIRFLGGFDDFSIVFWRLAIACGVLTTLLLFSRRLSGLGTIRSNLSRLVILGFFLGLHFMFFVPAVKETTIMNATVLVNMTPIFSVFFSSLLFKLRPSRVAALGLVLSFAGLCIVAYADVGIVGIASPSLKGDLEAVLAALMLSLYINLGRETRKEMNLLSIMIPVYLFAALFAAALSVLTPQCGVTLPADLRSMLALLGLGVLPTAIAHTLYFSSLSNLKSFETATLALLEPVGATILGVAIFREMPTSLFVLGAALILAGLFFVMYKGESR